ncbi:hypothetical protein JST99_01650 [Candidatus Dependentiae bacterium]|nr:hypothetical protein [Candidatus Dependentiae bacterium]MCC7414797.1 hypothetical protein [Campylobacterota bacterium]
MKRTALTLFLLSLSCVVFAVGDLTIMNNTLGRLRFKIVRNGKVILRSQAIEQGNAFKRRRFLNVGDQVTFPVADNTRGPLLPEEYTVGSLNGRTADVTMTCDSSGCTAKES